MFVKIYNKFIIFIFCFIFAYSCTYQEREWSYHPVILASTEIIAEATKKIGGNFITVNTITNKGSDIRTRIIGEYDLINLEHSDLIFYTGLYHEGRL